MLYLVYLVMSKDFHPLELIFQSDIDLTFTVVVYRGRITNTCTPKVFHLSLVSVVSSSAQQLAVLGTKQGWDYMFSRCIFVALRMFIDVHVSSPPS